MAISNGVFGITLRDILDASQLAVNVDSDTFKMSLHTDTMTPDFNAWDFYADLTNEVPGTGNYTTGGKAMSGETITASGGLLTFDATDTAWTSATISSIRGRVVYDDTLTSDPLLLCTTFGADYAVTAGTLMVQENASGLWYVDYIP
jgi:hypothetical protein